MMQILSLTTRKKAPLQKTKQGKSVPKPDPKCLVSHVKLAIQKTLTFKMEEIVEVVWGGEGIDNTCKKELLEKPLEESGIQNLEFLFP